MPIYQRTCNKCEFSEENIEKFLESDIPKDCPDCKMKNSFIKDVSSGTAFKMKGECNAEDGYTYSYTNCKANFKGKGGKHGTRKRFG